MEERDTGFELSRSLFGRKVAVILPLLLVAMVILAFTILPSRYYVNVKGGELGLWVGKFGWLDSQRSRAFDPIPLGDGDYSAIEGKSFASEREALAALRDFFKRRLYEEQGKVAELEKELVAPYTSLLKNLKGARAVGLEGLDKNIDILQGWLDLQGQRR